MAHIGEELQKNMKKTGIAASEKRYQEPGIWETIRELLLGVRRPLDCIQVGVSSRCPGRCAYCPHSVMKEQWVVADMDLDTFSMLWPLMRRSSRVHLQGWGEPLLNPAFFEMATLARRAGCAVSTTTCGLIMDEKKAIRLVEGGFDVVAFSLAGTDTASNACRQGVDFGRVCEAVTILQTVRRSRMAVHMEIHFAYLMLASNMDAVRALPALMEKLGVHAAVISTLDYIPRPDLAQEAFSPHETDKLSRAREILKETGKEARRMGLGFHWALPCSDAPGTKCRENIARSLYVSSDGSMSPCVYVNLPVEGLEGGRRIFGNVHDRDPLEIWDSEEFRHFRDRLADGDPDPLCMQCVKRFECVES